MKKNNFLQGAFIATFSIVLVKIIGVLYVIPFKAIVGENGGALYGYAYNIYMIFLGISSAGIPFAISKLMSEYDALGYNDTKEKAYNVVKKFISILSVILFLILIVLAPLFAQLIVGPKGDLNYVNDVSFVIRMVSFAILVVPFLSITKGYLQGHKYIKPASISQIIEQIVRVTVILLGSYIIVYVFKLEIKYAIGISAFAAFVGGLIAFIYLSIIIKKYKGKLNTKPNVKNNINSKEIIKKIISYAVPFIITGVAFSIYNFSDMVIIRRTLTDILNYNIVDVESITAIYATWASKLLAIIISISTGLITSLIPNIVHSYTLNDIKDVNKKVNKSIQIILLIIVPLTIFLSMLSQSIWTLFYGESIYGAMIFKVYIFTALATSFSSLVSNILQGISKYKMVYIVVLSGLIANISLDIPLMLLFNKMGIFPVYGASISTVISMLGATFVGLVYLSKKENINYRETISMLPKLITSWFVFIIIILILKSIVPYTLTGRLIQIPVLILYTLIAFGIYATLNYYNGNINKLFGKISINKLIKRRKDN